MPTGDNALARRRYLRFSVRGLILVVLAMGVWLGWLVRSARIQREAVAAITKAGASVEYNRGWTSGDYIPGRKPSKPGRLANLIGVDYFSHVTDVWLLSSSTVTDEVIAQAGRLAHAERLHLYRSSISDVGLAHLKRLTNLAYLDLGGTQVSDAGLAHLRGLTKLSYLDLGSTRISDAGLAHLKGLTRLSILGLGHTQVSDAGLAHLKGLTNLSSVGLSGTQVTGAGVEELQRELPRLKIFH
jgi:hypothetical protein